MLRMLNLWKQGCEQPQGKGLKLCSDFQSLEQMTKIDQLSALATLASNYQYTWVLWDYTLVQSGCVVAMERIQHTARRRCALAAKKPKGINEPPL